eukprot:3048020-Rhodomonas_salina.1
MWEWGEAGSEVLQDGLNHLATITDKIRAGIIKSLLYHWRFEQARASAKPPKEKEARASVVMS